MADFTTIAQRYIDAWNTTDPQRRRAVIEDLWSPDGEYVDPLAESRGHAAIDTMIATVQSQFPDFRFRLAGSVDAHHNQARFRWELGPGEGEAPVVGFDVVVADDNGRLSSVYGFLDRVPTA
ncbi:MAG TPA: nuclear transport factor 2 family protein [Pseudonocardia sp.]|jgi:hypothetical protein|nr:nuclear transport factor 2 family protein [Pseudonocardia sp.]